MRGSRTFPARIIMLAAAVALVTGAGPMGSAPAQAGRPLSYRAVDLGFEGRSTAINDRRQVVGEMLVDPVNRIRHPFLWQRGRPIDLGGFTTGPLDYGEALDINNRGQVVGRSTIADGSYRAFLWQDGVLTNLGTLGGWWSTALGINDRGQVLGISATAAGETRSFLWENGVMTDLGIAGVRDINNRGEMVGGRLLDGVPSAFRLVNGEVTRIDPRPSSAMAINEAGTVVGYLAYEETETNEAYLWRGSEAVFIGEPGTSSNATDINDRGEVLMQMWGDLVLWRNGVRTPLSTLGVTVGWTDVAVLNNRGDIAASLYYLEPGQRARVYLRR